MKKPDLIEPGMKYYMDYALENSHKYKKQITNYIFNGTLFLLFISVFSLFLYYGYKNKPSPEEREKDKRIKTQQIIEKVRSINHQFSYPNPNTFQEKYSNKDCDRSMEEKLADDPYIITNLPPLKFM
jgi:hypothetical protein